MTTQTKTAPRKSRVNLSALVDLILSNDSPQNYDDADCVIESVQSEIEADYYELTDDEASDVGELCEDWFNSEDQDEEGDDE